MKNLIYKIDVYNILKITGILLITLCHVGLTTYGDGGIYWHLHAIGRYGVIVFVFVSGYGIYNSLSFKNPKYFDFVKSRFYKIAWAYYISLIIYVLFQYIFRHSFDFISTIAHIFFIHNLSLTTEVYPAGHLWFMGLIMQLYLFAPLMYKFLSKKFVLRRKNISLITALISTFIIYKITDDFDKVGFFFCYRSFLYYLHIFLLGMILKKYTNFNKGTILKPIGNFTFYIYLANYIYRFPLFLEIHNIIPKTQTIANMLIYIVIIVMWAFFLKYLEIMIKKLIK